jgi:hypothetical protein
VVHPVVDLAVLLQQLQALGQLPLRGQLAAVAGDPRLAALVRQRVDPLGVRLRGVVLPQLDVGMRRPRNSGSSHSGVPSASAGNTVQAVKSVAMPMTSSGDTPLASRAAGTAVRSTST